MILVITPSHTGFGMDFETGAHRSHLPGECARFGVWASEGTVTPLTGEGDSKV